MMPAKLDKRLTNGMQVGIRLTNPLSEQPLMKPEYISLYQFQFLKLR